jgi:hypothetical protein
MESHPKPRQAPRALYGVRRRPAAYHEARRAEHPILMPLLDGLVDRVRQPEIVGRDDEPLQRVTSRRSLRKRKNSTPSCKRRFIISGLSAISPTMAAIFGTRK